MKLNTKSLFGLAVLSALCAATPVSAMPITDTVNPADTTITFGTTPSPCPAGFTCDSGALTFVHDITDNGFTVGDTITSATIDIHLTEQVVTGVNNETYRYDIGAQTFSCVSGNCVSNGGITDHIALTSSLTDLATDGMISITVRSLSGNFLFADSVLTAQVVPVPSTLVLLAAGFIGFGGVSVVAVKRGRGKRLNLR